MAEWWAERGIGETRFAQVHEGRIIAARIVRDGVVEAGTRLAARLRDNGRHGRNALAEAGGETYLLPAGAPGITEGAALTIEVTRERLAGQEPWKRALAKACDAAPGPAVPLAATALAFPAPSDPLADAGWDELLDEARTGRVDFPGGALTIFPTPAMALIDVDGTLPADALAIAGAAAAGAAIRRLGIAGSIGIDLPTMGSKAARAAAADALDEALAGEKFERTAVNGFGFVQLVRPRRHASLLELALDRPAFEARALLRRAARETGAITLVAHPAVIAALAPEWVAALARQVGGAVDLRAEPGCAMAAGDAVRR